MNFEQAQCAVARSPAAPPPGSHYSPTSPKKPWGRLNFVRAITE
jgi:hypothetical protein